MDECTGPASVVPMKVLVADDEAIARRTVSSALAAAGFSVVAVPDGTSALSALLAPDGPKLAVLDWTMPGRDGIDVVRLVRGVPTSTPPYLVMLTAIEGLPNIVSALDSGANDYIVKSRDVRELVSRVRVGARVVQLQEELARRVRETEEALAHVRRLQGLLPICSYCKRVRADQDYWQEIEHYIQENSDADFSHSVCPRCYEKILGPQIERFEQAPKKNPSG